MVNNPLTSSSAVEPLRRSPVAMVADKLCFATARLALKTVLVEVDRQLSSRLRG